MPRPTRPREERRQDLLLAGVEVAKRRLESGELNPLQALSPAEIIEEARDESDPGRRFNKMSTYTLFESAEDFRSQLTTVFASQSADPATLANEVDEFLQQLDQSVDAGEDDVWFEMIKAVGNFEFQRGTPDGPDYLDEKLAHLCQAVSIAESMRRTIADVADEYLLAYAAIYEKLLTTFRKRMIVGWTTVELASMLSAITSGFWLECPFDANLTRTKSFRGTANWYPFSVAVAAVVERLTESDSTERH